jgi:hypothetical protein
MRISWVIVAVAMQLGTAAAKDPIDYWCVGKTCYRAESTRPKGCDGETGKCEAQGSRPTRLLNGLHFFLAEAKRAKANKVQCQKLADRAALIASVFDDYYAKVIKGHSDQAGKTYVTRYDGALSEAKAVALSADEATQALALFKECGGKTRDTDIAAGNQGLVDTGPLEVVDPKASFGASTIGEDIFHECEQVKAQAEYCGGNAEGRGVTMWGSSYFQCTFRNGKATKCKPFTGKTIAPCHGETMHCLCEITDGNLGSECDTAKPLAKSKYIR